MLLELPVTLVPAAVLPFSEVVPVEPDDVVGLVAVGGVAAAAATALPSKPKAATHTAAQPANDDATPEAALAAEKFKAALALNTNLTARWKSQSELAQRLTAPPR